MTERISINNLTSAQLDDLYTELDKHTNALTRVRKACDSVRAADQGHNPAVDWVVTRVLEAIDARPVRDGLPPTPAKRVATQATDRDCLFTHDGAHPCPASDRCATCDPKDH